MAHERFGSPFSAHPQMRTDQTYDISLTAVISVVKSEGARYGTQPATCAISTQNAFARRTLATLFRWPAFISVV